jgi:hypothetical protein
LILDKIINWYKGENKIVQEEDYPESGIFVMPYIDNKKYWTSKIINIFVNFYLKHWKWLWGILISIYALIVKD